MARVVIIVMVLIGAAALVVGIVVVMLAVRRAPDGFEDGEGFHAAENPEPPVLAEK